MTLHSFLLIPVVRQTKRGKQVHQMPVWKLVDAQTGKTRCEMTNPQDAETVIESLILADLMVSNCANVGIYLPEFIGRDSF